VDTAVKAVTSATVNTQKVEAQVEVLNQLERDCGTLPAEYAQKRQELHASLVALKLHFQTCNDEYNAAQRDLAKEIDKARQQLGAQDQLKGIDLLASFSPTKVGEARPQPVLPGATAVDPMVIQMLISGQEATAKAMDRLASALESGIGEKSEKWRSLQCWTAPTHPGELSVPQYIFQIKREMLADPLRSHRQRHGDRQANEHLMNRWSHVGWYRMMREDERLRLFESPMEEVLAHVLSIYVGPDEVRRFKSAMLKSLKKIAPKETVAHYLVRCRAGLQQVAMVGGVIPVDDLIDMLYEAVEGHALALAISTLLADFRVEGQGATRETGDSYLYRLATRQCHITRESLARLEAEMDLSEVNTPVGDIEMSPMEGGYNRGRGRGDGGWFRGRAEGGRGRGREYGGRGRGDGRGRSGGSPGAGGGRQPQVLPANPDARICWQWRDEGRCGRTTCHFAHPEPRSQRPNWRAPSQDRAAGGGNSSQ
jgi:hypothetical protein